MTDDNALPRRAFVAGLLGAGFAAEAVPMTARWNGPQVRGSGWLEWRLVTTQGGFDPAQFDIGCDFTGTQGEALSVTAFWDGKHWVMRLLPPATGTWHAAPRGLGQPFTFKVDKVVARQHIGIDPQDPRYFAFDDGSPFVPIGLNICWASSKDNTLADYRRWFQRLADSGGNFARLWMASWSFGIEWTDTGLGNYGARMNRAAELDAVFELAESLGLKLMLCLINHGAFTEKNDAEWQANPYNKANGGPLAAPEDFVTDEQAMLLFERRVRYIAARWAHSPALHSWEWWNEVTWTPIKAAALRPWFTRMSKVLDAHDPYRRLRSSSWADRGDAVAWQMPELNYAQQHDYTTRDLMLHYADAARAWEADGIAAKPLFASELGLETTFDAKAPRSPAFNFDAVHLHNGLWAPLFNGFAATALYWWWDHLVDPLDMWPIYRGVARYLAALHSKGLRLAGHHRHAARFSGGAAKTLALAGKTSVLVWVRADLHDATALRQASNADAKPAQPWQPPYQTVDQGRAHLNGLALNDGSVQVRWFDTHSGDLIASTDAVMHGGSLELACPAFTRSIAAIVSPT